MLRENRYDRFVFGPAVVGWEYEYWNQAAKGVSNGMSTGFEVSVQLRGEWFHRGTRSGSALFGPGQICSISPAEKYATSFVAKPDQTGLQIGFIFYPDKHDATRDVDEVLTIPKGIRLEDERFLEMCRALHDGFARGCPLPDAQVAEEVSALVLRSAEVEPTDSLLMAKRELDREFSRPLYMDHVAEIAGMHAATFARKFTSRFGTTPVKYRNSLRLNEAALLTWSRPDLEIGEIGATVGFEDPSYFHRAFRRHFGKTPAEYGGRNLGR